MKFLRPIILGAILGVMASCTLTLSEMRLIPKYNGVDPAVATYVSEWMSLAKDRKLTFDREVSIGFMNIDEGATIGITNYGFGFTEIDLDKRAWNSYTKVGRTGLVFHELAHAYCYRDHDFASGTPYPENTMVSNSEKDGFFRDGCSLSLMCPFLMDDNCILAHYNEYVKEIFNRCTPI